jgi:hypothetical protein
MPASTIMNVLDALALSLQNTTAVTALPPTGIGMTIVIGSWEQSEPADVPALYIDPQISTPTTVMTAGSPGSGAFDIVKFTFEAVMLYDLTEVGAPYLTTGQQYSEQPGVRALVGANDVVRSALRENITISGAVASSIDAQTQWGKFVIDSRIYRGSRTEYDVTYRRPR